jgi:ACS family tartrate transporter-like MFS transporter
MDTLEQRTMARVSARRVPFLIVCYFIAYLDRVNVSFAALTMNKDIGLSASAYGLGAGIFFLPYAVFEVPSNLLLAHFCARRWIARIMFTWGIMPGRWPSSAARQGSTWCVSCWGWRKPISFPA